MFFDPPLLTFLSIVVVSVTSLGFVEARRRKKNAVANEGVIDQLEWEVKRTRQAAEKKATEVNDYWRNLFDHKNADCSKLIQALVTEKQVLTDRSFTEKKVLTDRLFTEKKVLTDRLAESDRQKRQHARRHEELLTEKIVHLAKHDAMKKERDTAIKRLRTSEGQTMVLRHQQHGYRRRA